MEEFFSGSPGGTFNDIKEEVRSFVTDRLSYYGVTTSGFLFNIVKTHNYCPDISDHNDYFSYMWLECVDGFYLLRRHFLHGFALPWVLEVELIPDERDMNFYFIIRDYLTENPDKLFEFCGEPIEQEIPKNRKPYYIDYE